MAVEKIQVPDLGDSDEVEVIEVLVGPGDSISENDSLIVLESDKAAMEIPASREGVVKEMLLKVGDKVSTGDDILSLETEAGDDDTDEAEPEVKAESEAQQSDEPGPEKPESSAGGSMKGGESKSSGGTRVQEVKVPDLGGSDDVEVIDVLVSPGDEIKEEDGLVTLETDKAAMDVPSPAAGKVKSVKLKVGDKVSEGTLILELETSGGDGGADEGAEAEADDDTDTQVADESAGAADDGDEGSGEPAVEEIKVPDLGDADQVEVIDVLVSKGDEITADDGLVTLETDKAAMDVPAPKGGKVVSVKLKVGDKVSEGDVILELETVSSGAKAERKEKQEKPKADTASPKKEEKPSPQPERPEPSEGTRKASSQAEVYAGPAVRKLARELGVDLKQVKGTGTRNRIVKEDVHAFVKSALKEGPQATGGGIGLPPAPEIDFSRFGEVEEVEMSKLHRVTAQNMTRCWLSVPHVTQFDEADVTELEEFRAAQKNLAEKKGIKLTPLPFIIKACALALAEYPQFNVSLHPSGEKLIQKKYIHVGVAVATPAGLMVPVIRDADKKSLWDIAAEVADLSAKAKERKLTKEMMEGACFTVSSLGPMGGTGFTPIVNSPEVAILGVSKTTVKPVYRDGEFVPRKLMPYSLSYDHRAVNGVDGGLFCTYLTELLGDIRLMLL